MRCMLLALLLLVPALPAQDEDDDGITTDESPIPEDETEGDKRPPRAKPGVPAPAEPKASLPERINAAIDKGVVFLRARANEEGSYGPCVAGGTYGGGTEDSDCYRIGPTAFSIFTLRKCGVPRNDKGIKRSLKWLKKRCRKSWTPDHPRPHETQFAGKGTYLYSSYEASAVIMMLVQLNKKDLRPGKKAAPVKMSKDPTKPARGWKKDEWRWMHELVQFLIKNPHPRMPPVQLKNGGWRYWPPYREADQDLSATQFALLGLRAAVSAGYPVHLVEPNTWRYAADAAASFQLKDGGFRYQNDAPWTCGMTAAGIACLLICKEQLTNMERPVPDWIDERVARGLEFLGKNLDFSKNRQGKEGKQAHGTGYHFYHLYGIERVGALSKKKEIGGKAWYPRGAAWLVDQQRPDGAWAHSGMRPRDVLDTCFALLFLKKATMPAVTVAAR